MSHFFIKLVLFCTISVGLHAQSGLAQQYLASVSPEHLAEFESPNTNIEIAFTMPVEAKSIHKNTVVLKAARNQRLSGTSKAVGNKIVFTPDAALEAGTYEVLVQKVKLDDPSTNNTQTERINYNFTVPDLQSIAISLSSIEVKEGAQTTLSLTGTYAGGSTKEILNNIEWTIQNNSIASISNNTLSGLTEGVTTIQAKFNNITSTPATVVVYKEINGYKLPPEPDPVVNNSTLLGIDFNNNGVRDDVERKIYFQYKRPIEQAYMMQEATWYPQTLENPVAAAASEELEKENWNRATCDVYLRVQGIEISKSVEFLEAAYFNTKERMRAYVEFNEAMSGGVYHMPLLRDANKDNCNFNIDALLEMEK